uniref:BHLH domain-containing protein n=1 Tax=Meloidogyne floridensis TaxID=298350 RepID=A0A915PD77_9BILA
MIKYHENSNNNFNFAFKNEDLWTPPIYFNIQPTTSTHLKDETFSSNTPPPNTNNYNNLVKNSVQPAVPINERLSRKRTKNEKQSKTTTCSIVSNPSTSPTRPPKAKRKKSATKEKMRNLEIKTKLRELNSLMPFVGSTELPRIRILRLANAYIEHLTKILNGHQDFAIDVNNEMKKRNSYSHLVEDYEEQTRKVSECSKESDNSKATHLSNKISPQSSKSFN